MLILLQVALEKALELVGVVLVLAVLKEGRVGVRLVGVGVRGVAKVVEELLARLFDLRDLLFRVHVGVAAQIFLRVSLQLISLRARRAHCNVVLNALLNHSALNAFN